MNWKTEYNAKKVSLEQALRTVKSGNRVVVGHATGEPVSLVEELIKQKERLTDVEIVHMVAIGKCEYCYPGMENIFAITLFLWEPIPAKRSMKEEQILRRYFFRRYRDYLKNLFCRSM